MARTFIFDADETPAELAERKRRAAALLAAGQGGIATNVGQGIAQLGHALAGRIGMSSANKAEQKRMAAARKLLMGIGVPGGAPAGDPLMGGAGSDALAGGTMPKGKDGFVDMLAPAAVQYGNQIGVDPRIILAQAALETGWGAKAPGNNYFGIKSHGKKGGQTFATHEIVNGKRVNIRDSFRQFSDPADSVAGYADFLTSNKRYKPMLAAKGDLNAQLAALGQSGYATDPNYANKLSKIISMLPPDLQGAPQGQPQIVPASAPPPGEAMPPQPPQMASQPQVMPAGAPMPPQAPQGPMSPYQRQMGNAMDRGSAPEAVQRQMQGAPQGGQGGGMFDGLRNVFAGIGGGNQPAPEMAPAMAPEMAAAPGMEQPAPEQGGNRLAQIQQAMFSPWVSEIPGAQEFLAREYEREMARINPEPMDPLKQLQLEKGQLELEQMRNPQPKPAEPPKTRDFIDGNQRVTQEWDQASGTWREVARGDAYKTTPDTVVNTGSGVKEERVFDETKARADAARAATTGLNSLREASAALPGAITGAAADQRLGLQKIASLFGVGDTQAIQDTETFRSAIAPQVAAMLKATVGTAQISNADREFAEKAAGGSISLDGKSIERLINIMRAANSEVVRGFNRDLNMVYPDNGNFQRERALFNVPNAPKFYGSPIGPQMEQAAPPQPAPNTSGIPAPPGVDPREWEVMSDEDKALWLN